MSAVAKMHLTDVTIGNEHFKVPKETAKGLILLFTSLKVTNQEEDGDEEYIDASEIAEHLHKETSKAAVRLRGFRHRDGLTQAQLAKKLNTSQSVVASMERAKRVITYKMAQKLAKLFDTSPRAFLEN